MTLLTVVTNICDEIGFDAPTSVIGSSNETAIQMLALANRGGKQLAKRGKGVGGWAVLQTEHTFTTTDGTEEYALPSGFDFLLDDTLWDRTNQWRLWGPISPVEWQRVKSGVLASSTGPRRRVRIRPASSTNVKAFYVHPTPTVQSAWAADTDTGILDEILMEMDLKWRFAKAKGLEYAEDKREFELELAQALARDGGARMLDMAETGDLLLTANITDANFPSS